MGYRYKLPEEIYNKGENLNRGNEFCHVLFFFLWAKNKDGGMEDCGMEDCYLGEKEVLQQSTQGDFKCHTNLN